MSDSSSKPAIPAWQRAQQPLEPETQTSSEARVEEKHGSEGSDNTTAFEHTHSLAAGVEESTATETTSTDTDQVRAFLQDPAVKDESVDKKRAFLESKCISKDLIDQELAPASSAMNAADFASFNASTKPKPRTTPPPQPQKLPGPPIITYPEFLAEAHKPPPLITPSRIINTAYIASGLAALIYGASTFLITPAIANLTEARHDFATHSNSKISVLNDRLSQLVSRLPEPKKEEDSDDIESVTSDPTELFHRDMGTQTSPQLSPSPPTTPSTTKTTAEKHNDRLAIIYSHLAEILSGVETRDDSATKDRQDEVDKLRHDLDNMLFRMPATSVWSTAVDGTSYRSDGGEAGKQDAIEEFKKEIRGVKGVLLSAKRFAPVAGVGR